jgi:hypothetical protein
MSQKHQLNTAEDEKTQSKKLKTNVSDQDCYVISLNDKLTPSPEGESRHPYKQYRTPRVNANLKVEAGDWRDQYQMHGFIQAIHEAFSCHYTLVLKPTDIWQLIIEGVSKVVHENAGELRSKFVEHKGQEEIIVERDEFVKGSKTNDWSGVFDEFSGQIQKRVTQSELPKLFTKDFATSTNLTRMVSHITLMDSMQSYFKYILRTRCGIPAIQLDGPVEDWLELRQRVEAFKLNELKLAHWVNPLSFVLKQFEQARQGNPDLEFWNNFYKYEQSSGSDSINGFVLLLFPDKINACCSGGGLKPRPDFDTKNLKSSDKLYPVSNCQFPLGVVSAPFVWKYYGQTLKMSLHAGFGDCLVQDNKVSVSMGWKVVYDD